MNLQKGIHETTEYLETFLRDWLLNENNELYNRNLHISGLLIEEKVDIGDTKVDIKNEKVDIQDKKWILKAAGLRIFWFPTRYSENPGQLRKTSHLENEVQEI